MSGIKNVNHANDTSSIVANLDMASAAIDEAPIDSSIYVPLHEQKAALKG
jgi:hypothetical protein